MASNQQKEAEKQQAVHRKDKVSFLLRNFQNFYLLNPIVNIPIQTLIFSSYIFAVTAITQHDPRSQRELGPPVACHLVEKELSRHVRCFRRFGTNITVCAQFIALDIQARAGLYPHMVKVLRVPGYTPT